MQISAEQQSQLKQIPGVDLLLELLKQDSYFDPVPNTVKLNAIRLVVANLRDQILKTPANISSDSFAETTLLSEVKRLVASDMTPNLRRVINATGIVVHTNLGRSLLADKVVENLAMIARRYSNLEYDLAKGKRGSRYSSVEGLLCELTGAEAALAVNNNAGAVLLSLETMARNRKVIVSRGELVEIGGSFRVPDVMAKSGGILKEVGTTNRTHLRDYENAIEPDTALLLKVHRSNYSVVGFTAEVPLKELVALGNRRQIPVMEDLGSGTFIDFSQYGLMKEPTVRDSIAAGPDVVTFSGDKLLGGPQAGIIVGKKRWLDRIKQNPIARALRIDKLTLAALEGTLRLYRDPADAIASIPTLRLLTQPKSMIDRNADQLYQALKQMDNTKIEVERVESISKSGGGSLPLLDLPTTCIRVKVAQISANAIEKMMRRYDPPVIGRIEDDSFLLDIRTVQEDEISTIVTAFEKLLQEIVP